jgi:hypothetical protein
MIPLQQKIFIYLVYLYGVFVFIQKNSVFLCIFQKFFTSIYKVYINISQYIYYQNSFIFQVSIYKDTCK